MLLGILLTAGCRLHDKVQTHKFELDTVCMGADDSVYEIIGDLEGRQEEYQIVSGAWGQDIHWIMLRNRNGKVISQVNTGRKVRGMCVLSDPRDNSQWLFYSINDQRRVALNGIRYEWKIPLQRHEKLFESLGREHTPIEYQSREWYAMIYPNALSDIDSDGRPELVCSAYDGFTADPRGLVVYDFDTGKIKWKFETASNLTSILIGDYDGDGNNEIITSNRANRNTEDIRNQIDDMNCWIAVLDVTGKLLYHTKYTDGYSQLQLVEADTDQDGRKEIYGLNITWGSQNIKNSVSIIEWDGKNIKRKKTWALSSTFEQSLDNVILNDMDENGKWRLLLTDKAHGLTVLDKELRPVEHNFKEFISVIYDVEDVNNDGIKEVLVRNANGEFVVLDDDFSVRARLRNPFPEAKNVTGYFVSTGFNNPGRIAISTGRNVKYYHFVREPWHALAFRIVRAYSGVLCLLLLLGWMRMLFLARIRRKRDMAITDGLGVGLIETNGRGRLQFANKYAASLYPALAKKGRKPKLQLIAPELWSSLMLCGQSHSIGFEMGIVPEGSDASVNHRIWLLAHRRIFGKYIIIIMPKIRPVEDLEAKLAWADIARRLSHNVRHHITNVILAISELESNRGIDSEGMKSLSLIRIEIDKVRTFTHSFQRFTELEDYSLKLQDIIPSMEHNISHLVLPENVKLLKSWNMHSIMALIEPIRFEEALHNILNNAVEAMPSGGNLLVTAREFPAGSSPQGNLTILVEVEDSGKGIPAKYLEEIWKPFFTTNPSGTGIGIPESRKIIESMGGKMLIHSEEGVGTVVSFWLKGAPHE